MQISQSFWDIKVGVCKNITKMVYILGEKLFADKLEELESFGKRTRIHKNNFVWEPRAPYYKINKKDIPWLVSCGAVALTARDLIEIHGMVDNTEYLRKINQDL
jgi:hypothetical protein